MAINEHILQAMCVAWFRETYPQYLMWASLNGIKLSGKNKYGTITKEKAAGYTKGVPDTTVCLPTGVTLHIEFKTESKSSKQSPEQIKIQQILESMNHLYFICRTFQQFKQIIHDNLSLSDNN